MRVEYGDEILRRLAEERGFRSPRCSQDLVTTYRRRIQTLDATEDEQDLRALQSLRFIEDQAGLCSIRLNDQFRLVLRLRSDSGGWAVVVLEVIDITEGRSDK
jgi:proteic killer suppression protein